jgi:hypothetical protein
MAERRMFSKRIVNSARFIRMPISTQALYFHLGINADDDGIVEAYTVMKSIGCTEDDLRVLVAKNFVQVLNEDLVAYIIDWTENNHIRPDRKVDSIYKELLISLNPDVKLIEKKPRADASSKKRPLDVQWTTSGQPMDGIGKDSIGKDSIGKDSIDIISADKSADSKPKRHKHGEFKHVLLTDDEYSRLISDYGEDIAHKYIKKVDEYCEQSGKTYKNYNLAIRNTFMKRDGITAKDDLEALNEGRPDDLKILKIVHIENGGYIRYYSDGYKREFDRFHLMQTEQKYNREELENEL